MAHDSDGALAEARALRRQLRALGEVTAPVSLRVSVCNDLKLGDAYFQIESPLGPVYVAYNDLGISAVTRAPFAIVFEEWFRDEFGGPIYPALEAPARLRAALEHTLRGEGRPTLHFDLRHVSEFERAVLLKALEIPRGEVRPYAWVAREIGHPRAVRAVGTALAHNPVPLFIPCHRVVRSDGTLGQYGLGGPEAKRTVLAAEGAEPEALEALARSGVRYFGSDTTHTFCFPSCGHAQRITDPHRIHFTSAADARMAGYRPCKACRPA
jgi:O-6-methylguanine DNA methyltransferase